MATPGVNNNSDLPPQSLAYGSRNFGSINMDELLENMYADAAAEFPTGGAPFPNIAGKRTAAGAGASDPDMTLEDFLTQAGAVSEEEVRIPAIPQPSSEIGAGEMMHADQFPSHQMQNGTGGYGLSTVGFENGGVNLAAGVGRGNKRRAVEEPPMDRVTQQRQKRMIKNRESAARSRDRKHAYTVELEALVTKLEEENSQLLREEAEQSKERFKQLMENLIPVVEKRKPPRVLRRVHSMCW